MSMSICAQDSEVVLSGGHPLQVANRLGETIYKGHRSYDLMLNLQLGIRHSVQAVAREPALDKLEEAHFRQKVLHAIADCG